jgi:Tol biopolymer transport system component
MKKTVCSLIFIFFFLTSCASGEKSSLPSQEPTTEPKPQSTSAQATPSLVALIPSLTPTATPTFEVPAPTQFVTEEKWLSDDMGPIAYINDDGIFLMNGDGYFVSQVYKNSNKSLSLGYEISWSMDGKTIAFFGNSYSDIYLLDVSSGTAKRITDDRLSIERDPAFSPDGEKIVFSANLEGKGSGKPNMSLYDMNRDGSGIQMIYKCPEGQCGEPDWSSQNRIAFEEYGNIFTIYPDGSDLKNLTNGKGYNYSPMWSPDGKKIAFVRKADLKSETGYLYTMNFDGTGLVPLTSDAGSTIDVGSWSPDGRFIAFKYVTWDGPLAIYIYDVENGKMKRVSGSDKFDPTWYPIQTASYKPEEIISHTDCTSGWSKVIAGEKARVAGDSYASPNRVRSGPSKADALIGEIKPQTVVTILVLMD